MKLIVNMKKGLRRLTCFVGVLCMLLTMAVLALPYFWYKCEVAINEAYGYENMDSFNMIGEYMAKSFLPLVAGVPLSLLYLLCLKKHQKK